MTNEERLNIRARQLLDDPTLPSSQRLPNAAHLLAVLKADATRNRALRDSVLADIADPAVRAAMAAELA